MSLTRRFKKLKSDFETISVNDTERADVLLSSLKSLIRSLPATISSNYNEQVTSLGFLKPQRSTYSFHSGSGDITEQLFNDCKLKSLSIIDNILLDISNQPFNPLTAFKDNLLPIIMMLLAIPASYYFLTKIIG